MTVLQAFLRSLIAWIFTAVYWVFTLAVMIGVYLGRLPDKIAIEIIHFWGNAVLRILGIELEYLNESTLTEAASRVVVVNHQSALDLLWGAAICPPKPLAIGKKEVIYIPFLNVAWWVFGFIRIDRKNSASAIRALNRIVHLIQSGHRSLFIAPEGTRSHDGLFGPFKKGAFHIAIQAQAPIYPVVVSRAYELMTRRSFIARPGKIKVYFLPPVSTQGKTSDDVASLMEEVRAQMLEVFNKINCVA